MSVTCPIVWDDVPFDSRVDVSVEPGPPVRLSAHGDQKPNGTTASDTDLRIKPPATFPLDTPGSNTIDIRVANLETTAVEVNVEARLIGPDGAELDRAACSRTVPGMDLLTAVILVTVLDRPAARGPRPSTRASQPAAKPQQPKKKQASARKKKAIPRKKKGGAK